MPDDPRPLDGSGSRSHPVHDLQHGPVLLIPADHFHQLFARDHKDGAVADHIQQNLRGQQTLDQHFLLPFGSQRWRIIPVLFRPDIFPSEEEFFRRRDRAELGFVTVRGDDQLIGVKQPGFAFF